MDIKRFGRLSKSGHASVVTTNGNIYLSFRRFDVEDGGELEPELQEITKEQVETRQVELKQELKIIEEVLSRI